MKQHNLKNPFAFQIGDLHRLMRQSFDDEQGLDLTRAQAKLLLSVWRSPGVTQQALAARLDIATMSVCRQIDTLEARGMIERRTDPSDRRVRRLFVTEQTEPIIKDTLVRIEKVSDAFLAPLDTQERATLISLLDRVITGAGTRKTGHEK